MAWFYLCLQVVHFFICCSLCSFWPFLLSFASSLPAPRDRERSLCSFLGTLVMTCRRSGNCRLPRICEKNFGQDRRSQPCAKRHGWCEGSTFLLYQTFQKGWELPNIKTHPKLSQSRLLCSFRTTFFSYTAGMFFRPLAEQRFPSTPSDLPWSMEDPSGTQSKCMMMHDDVRVFTNYFILFLYPIYPLDILSDPLNLPIMTYFFPGPPTINI